MFDPSKNKTILHDISSDSHDLTDASASYVTISLRDPDTLLTLNRNGNKNSVWGNLSNTLLNRSFYLRPDNNPNIRVELSNNYLQNIEKDSAFTLMNYTKNYDDIPYYRPLTTVDITASPDISQRFIDFSNVLTTNPSFHTLYPWYSDITMAKQYARYFKFNWSNNNLFTYNQISENVAPIFIYDICNNNSKIKYVIYDPSMSDDTSNNTINFNDDVSSFGTFVYYYAPGPTLTDTEMEHYIDNFNDSFIMGLNTNNVTSLSQVFSDNMNFNLNIGAWDVGSVINMFAMFHGASSFNQDISGWNVSSVTNMRSIVP